MTGDSLHPTLALESLALDHVPALLAAADDIAVHRTSSVPRPIDAAWFHERLAESGIDPPAARHFAVTIAGRPVGMTSLKKLEPVRRTGELSYWIGSAHQGRGIGTAAARETCQFGFRVLGLARIDAHALALANPGSIAVLTRLGFACAARPDMPAGGRFLLMPGDVWRFFERHAPRCA
jgi:RimJ/RimL family protein N-acetyltransferase